MDNDQTKSILTVALMAAFADGLKDERERESIRKLTESFGAEASIDLAALYRDVLLARPDLAEAVKPLDSQGLRQYAYEMAVGVVSADGAQNPAEGAFLAQLAAALQLPATSAQPVAQQASAMADAAVVGTVLGKASVSDADMDKSILNAAITNAALELLPESVASMAIIPLQLRLVYRIGKAYGYELDSSNARDFIATLGVGLTSQYVEQIGRKLLGGLLGGLGGGLGRSLGRQAASSGLTFATTYAIGRVAQRYYAGGRTLDSAGLKATFTSLLAEARGLAPQFQSRIEQAAQTIDTRNLVALVKQGSIS
jgi:uncharacterized protein (DUF697 family)